MNITPVSTESNAGISSLSGSNTIKLLEKQKEQLQEQIQKINESKLDDKAKQDRVKQLQTQIQQIDMEIQQVRSERLNKNNSHASNNGINDGNTENNVSGMTDLMHAAFSYSDMKLINGIKGKMQNSGQIIKTEIKLDGHTTSYKEKSLQNIESRTKSLDEKLGDAVRTVQGHIKRSADHEGSEQSKPVSEEEDSANRELKGKQTAYSRVDIKI